MSREDLSFASACDGLPIVYYRWRATNDSRATVQIAHGLGEQALRYSRLGLALTGAGFHVYANDIAVTAAR